VTEAEALVSVVGAGGTARRLASSGTVVSNHSSWWLSTFSAEFWRLKAGNLGLSHVLLALGLVMIVAMPAVVKVIAPVRMLIKIFPFILLVSFLFKTATDRGRRDNRRQVRPSFEADAGSEALALIVSPQWPSGQVKDAQKSLFQRILNSSGDVLTIWRGCLISAHAKKARNLWILDGSSAQLLPTATVSCCGDSVRPSFQCAF